MRDDDYKRAVEEAAKRGAKVEQRSHVTIDSCSPATRWGPWHPCTYIPKDAGWNMGYDYRIAPAEPVPHSHIGLHGFDTPKKAEPAKPAFKNCADVAEFLLQHNIQCQIDRGTGCGTRLSEPAKPREGYVILEKEQQFGTYEEISKWCRDHSGCEAVHVREVLPDPRLFTEVSSIDTLRAYLLDAVKRGDWHAVRDAAVDIELLLAKERE